MTDIINFGYRGRETPYVVTLMHGNHPVLRAEIDPFDGQFTKVLEIIDEARLPLPAKCQWESGAKDGRRWYRAQAALNPWRVMRLIPAYRAREYKERIKFSSPGALSLWSHMANLSDAYWIASDAEDFTQEMVSFHQNDFLSYFDKPDGYVSPDFTTNGNLTKYWAIRQGKRLLYKAAGRIKGAEPYNEAFAAALAAKLNLPYVPYSAEKRIDRDGHVDTYSVCEAFTSDKVEYVPAWEILHAEKKSNSESEYDFFLRCAKKLGIPDFRQDLDNLLAFDFLINNEDRHYGNFGFLRDVETLEWIGLAPIFDNGSSLWYDSTNGNIRNQNNQAKPFRVAHDRQIRLTHPCLDLSAIGANDIDALLTEHLGEGVSEERIGRIAHCVKLRLKSLAAWQESNNV